MEDPNASRTNADHYDSKITITYYLMRAFERKIRILLDIVIFNRGYRLQQQSIRRLVLVPPYSVFCSISFRCGGLSIERNQKPLTPEITPERNAPW